MDNQETGGDFLARTRMLLGDRAMGRLKGARVAVFGLGGVGAACAEALARSGVGHLTLVDHDVVTPSNLNRQLIALRSTLGQRKADACRRRLLDINPEARIEALPVFVSEETAGAVDFAALDAAADCVDTLAAKLLIAKAALLGGTYLVSCMGTGNRLDPARFRFADVYGTAGCPLARRMRKACREAGIPALRVLYSDEEPLPGAVHEGGRNAPGSVSFVPPVAGMLLAGDIVRRLVGRGV